MTLAAWAYRQMSFRLYHLLCASLCVKQDLSLSLYSCIPWGDESAVCVCDLVAGSSRKEPRLWVVPGILSLITGAVTKKTDDKEISLHSPELWLPGAVGSHDALDLPSYLTAEHGSCAPGSCQCWGVAWVRRTKFGQGKLVGLSPTKKNKHELLLARAAKTRKIKGVSSTETSACIEQGDDYLR